MKGSIAILAVMLASTAWSAGPDYVARAQIAHLLQYLEASGCQFQRNGSWYASPRATAHLDQKYEYLRDELHGFRVR